MVNDIREKYDNGVISDGERANQTIDEWSHTTSRVAQTVFETLRQAEGGFNPLFVMADSGARGSQDQIKQLAGMRGLMQKPQKKITGGYGDFIEAPITSNFREGLSVLEYIISTHGSRKGLADTALKTAEAGYLTRRLVDVAQDCIVVEEDCGTMNGLTMFPLKEGEQVVEKLERPYLRPRSARRCHRPPERQDHLRGPVPSSTTKWCARSTIPRSKTC